MSLWRAANTLREIINSPDVLEKNARARRDLDQDFSQALKARATQLGRTVVSEKLRLQLDALSPAETRNLDAIGEYFAILDLRGRYPGRTLQQVEKHGLIGAAELSVGKSTVTRGFKILSDEGREELSYEQIVLDHPDDFPTSCMVCAPNAWIVKHN